MRFGGPLASPATVHLVAGLNGSGKTRLARKLESDVPAVSFSLDEWMLRLHQLPYDDESYPELSERCMSLIWDTARQVLSAGVDVVLDWNQWSRARRKLWRARVDAAGYRLVLHHVDVPVETAVRRAEERARLDVPGSHLLDAAAVRHLASIFEPPRADEGIEIRLVAD